MRYAWAVLAVAWLIYMVLFVALIVLGVDVRGPFELLRSVL